MPPFDYEAAAQERNRRAKMLRDAAPDLLAALNYAVGKLIAFSDAETDEQEMWIIDDINRVIRTAINKANGVNQ